MTNPLVDGKGECEIEDLFLPETLNHEINGKRFDRTAEDTNKFYGKEIFSSYVASNYTTIDFSGFRPFLDTINQVIVDYKKYDNV